MRARTGFGLYRRAITSNINECFFGKTTFIKVFLKEFFIVKIFKIVILFAVAAVLVVAAVDLAATQRVPAQTAEPAPSQEKIVTPDDAPEKAVETFSREPVGWGPGNERNEKNQTVASISEQEKYEDLGAYFIFPDDDGKIYLTFDLGYENGYTEKILDSLKANNVKATFFVTMDYVKEAPEIVRRIIDEGHTVGNHTDRHPSMPKVDDERAKNEIVVLHDYVEENFGYTMKLFRFPMGEFSENSLNIVNELGYKSIFWSFAYRDWLTDSQPEPSAALKKLTDSLHGGGIFLLHAVSSTNAAIMDEFVKTAKENGYSFELIDERLSLVEKPKSNEAII